MGYAKTHQYAQLTLNTGFLGGLTLTGVVGSYDIAEFVTPAFNDPLAYAYVDLICQWTKDTSGADNFMQGNGQWGILDSLGTFRSSGNINDWTFYTNANATQIGAIKLTSTTNIAPYISPSTNHMLKFQNVLCVANNLFLKQLYGEMRLYFA